MAWSSAIALVLDIAIKSCKKGHLCEIFERLFCMIVYITHVPENQQEVLLLCLKQAWSEVQDKRQNMQKAHTNAMLKNQNTKPFSLILLKFSWLGIEVLPSFSIKTH